MARHYINIKNVKARAKILLLVLILAFPVYVILAQAYSPQIESVKVADVTETSALITWNTDKDTDATVNYGLNEDNGVMRDPSYKQIHEIALKKLEPATTYYFRVTSADSEGNRNMAGGFVFTTRGERRNVCEEEKPFEEESKEDLPSQGGGGSPEQAAIEAIGKITSAGGLKEVAGELTERAGEIMSPPDIIGIPRVYVETDYAEVHWVTDRESGSMVFLAPESSYDPNSSDPYSLSQGDPIERVKDHIVTVIGLRPGTTYHFQVVSEDDLGLVGRSEDGTFKTKSILPQIRNIRVAKVEETSATLTWSTDVPADGLVEYTSLKTGEKKSAGHPTFVTSHSVRLIGLELGVRYAAIIRSTNEAGDSLSSDKIEFVTVKDEAPPVIAKVNSESTLYPGEETKIQTIVGWETDEPALCQFFYVQGTTEVPGEKSESLLKEVNPVQKHTQVIIGLSPTTVYRFWLVCDDDAGNSAKSEDFVMFTPAKEKSIIDIIIENFQGTFGWLKNITG